MGRQCQSEFGFAAPAAGEEIVYMTAIVLTNENFEAEVLQADVPVLVDFWAPWCGPCRMVSPLVEEIAAAADGFKVGKVNTDEQADLAAQYGVMSLPTLAVFRNGIIAEKAVGARPKAAILKLLGK